MRVLLHADPSRPGRSCDNLGLTPAAEKYLSAAIAGDAKLSNAYPSCWFHFWQRRKLVRAETFSDKVILLRGGNRMGCEGVRDFQRLRVLAKDPDRGGTCRDPFWNFVFDIPNQVDEWRGA